MGLGQNSARQAALERDWAPPFRPQRLTSQTRMVLKSVRPL